MSVEETSERKLELKVGAFALIVLLLGGGVLLLLGQKRHVFEPRATLHTSFPDVGGLREGAPVWLSGVNAGTVTHVTIGAPGEREVRVDFEVQRRMLDRIHRDSVASIGSQGLLGDKLLEISLGSPLSPPLRPGESINSVPPADFNKLVDEANQILVRAKEVADNVADATRALADPQTTAAFRASMLSIRTLLEQANHGHGLAHSIFYDKQSAQNFERLTRELNQLVDHVDAGVKKLDSVLAATDGEGKQILNNLSRAAKKVGDTAEELERSKVIANLDKASHDLADITGFVKSGRGTLGSLIADPTVYEQLVQVLGGVQRSRILRALVRYAISRDEGKSAGKQIEGPIPSTTEVKTTTPAAVPKPTRAKR